MDNETFSNLLDKYRIETNEELRSIDPEFDLVKYHYDTSYADSYYINIIKSHPDLLIEYRVAYFDDDLHDRFVYPLIWADDKDVSHKSWYVSTYNVYTNEMNVLVDWINGRQRSGRISVVDLDITTDRSLTLDKFLRAREEAKKKDE